MPFNGSGTFTLPAGNPVSSNTPISSVTHNATNSDIASALTNCFTRDGQSTPTGNINFGGYKITGLAKGGIAGDAVRFEQAAKIDEATGENTDIKAITGLTTPLAVTQGGTGSTTSTGTGAVVRAASPTLTSPTLTTPALGTPASGNLANCTFPTLNQNTTGNAATATTAGACSGNAATSTKSTNISGGAAGQIPYQSTANTTLYTAAGVSGQFLQSNGTGAPTWVALSGTYAVLSANTFTADQTISGFILGNKSTPSNLVFTDAAVSSGTFNASSLYNTLIHSGTRGTKTATYVNNVVIGYGAFGENSSGNLASHDNVVIGWNAMANSTSSVANNNTAIGSSSGIGITSGANNTLIGSTAGADAVASITTQSNYVVIGNNATANANIKVAWTVTSDKRDKTNFADVPYGLEFVNQLKPTAYQFKLDRESDDVGENARVRYGFLAQDILALEGDNPVIINNDELEHLKYNESSMIPVLVKAIQELSAELAKLKN